MMGCLGNSVFRVAKALAELNAVAVPLFSGKQGHRQHDAEGSSDNSDGVSISASRKGSHPQQVNAGLDRSGRGPGHGLQL